MAKKKKEVTEEVAKVDLSNKAEATDNVTKVNLDEPIKPKEENETKEEVKEDNPDDSGVVGVDENADTTEKQEEVQPEAETQEDIQY